MPRDHHAMATLTGIAARFARGTPLAPLGVIDGWEEPPAVRRLAHRRQAHWKRERNCDVNGDPANGATLRPHPNADCTSQLSDGGQGTTAPGGSSGSSMASRIDLALHDVLELGIDPA